MASLWREPGERRAAPRRVLLASLIVVAVATTGCGDDDGDDAAASRDGPPVEAVATGKLAPSLPTSMPLPPGHTVVYSAGTTDDYALAVLDSALAPDALRAFFVEALPGNGWRLLACRDSDADEGVTTMTAVRDGWLASLVVGHASGLLDRVYPASVGAGVGDREWNVIVDVSKRDLEVPDDLQAVGC